MSTRIHARLLWVWWSLGLVLWCAVAVQEGVAADKPAASRWALLVGVDDYTNLQKLRYCGADMTALAETLARRGFPKDQVYLLHDKAESNRLRPLKANIERELGLILGLLEKNDLVVFAFSGHGVHLEGKSYLCPAESTLQDPSTLIDVDDVYRRLEKCRAAMKVIMVDACRDDPRPGGTRSAATLAEVKGFSESLERPPRGILLLASCAPGEKSWEEKEFGHGVFMHFVLSGLQGEADQDNDGAVSLVELYKYSNQRTKTYVAKKFADSQRPGLKGDLADDFSLGIARVEPKPVPMRPEESKPPENRRQVTAAFTVREGDEKGPAFAGANLELVYRKTKQSAAVVLGRGTSDAQGNARITVWLAADQQAAGEFLVVVSSVRSTDTWPLSAFPKTLDWNLYVPGQAAAPQVTTNSIGMKMVLIPAGEFMMGGSDSDGTTSLDEKPQHLVRITKSFHLGAHEVTIGQFRKFVENSGYKTEAEKDGEGAGGHNATTGEFEWRQPEYSWHNTGFEQTDDHPVVNVSWNDAVAFCEWLSRKEGKTYRLPTEAEWEYACRAGTTTRYWSGNDPETLMYVGNVADATAKAKLPDLKNSIQNSDGFAYTAPIGRFQANAFGLHDMQGNAWEWCADWYGKDYYAVSPSDDPKGPDSGTSRVSRGGAWLYAADFSRSAFRFALTPGNRLVSTGFRVARTP